MIGFHAPGRLIALAPGALLSICTMTQALTPADYLTRILNARVYDVAVESDLDIAKNLSRRLHNKVLLKREDQQPVFSFKLRGAYNKMANLTAEQLQKGVICASGNHAQGTAMSAKAGLPRRDRDAHHHAPGEDRCRDRPGRRGGGWRKLLRRLQARRQAAKVRGPDLCPPL
jgi:hypothetical protein